MSHQRRQQSSLTKRRGELAGMQGRLLNAYLAGSIDETTFKAKGDDLKAQVNHWARWKTSTSRAPKRPCSYLTGANERRISGAVQTMPSGARSWMRFV